MLPSKIIKVWLLLFLPYLAFKYSKAYKEDKRRQIASTALLAGNVGKKFALDTFYDSGGNVVKLDFSKSERTIVDFWYDECAPCIQEMNQFNTLLNSTGEKVRIVSISVNVFPRWKQMLKSKKQAFSFLENRSPNWEHFVMDPDNDFDNDLSGKSLLLLKEKFNSTTFPIYFVLDKQGIIIATPFSAVDYLNTEILKQKGGFASLKNSRNRAILFDELPMALVELSGFFWILTVFVSAFNKYRTKKPQNRQIPN